MNQFPNRKQIKTSLFFAPGKLEYQIRMHLSSPSSINNLNNFKCRYDPLVVRSYNQFLCLTKKLEYSANTWYKIIYMNSHVKYSFNFSYR